MLHDENWTVLTGQALADAEAAVAAGTRLKITTSNGERLMSAAEEAATRAEWAANALALQSSVVSCSPWQIRKALNQAGLRTAVEQAVAASGNQAMIDGWEFATEIRSDDPMVIAMGTTVGKSPAETRELIALAQTL